MNDPDDDLTRQELEAVIRPEDLDELEAIAADIIAEAEQEQEDHRILQRTFSQVGHLMADLVRAAGSDIGVQRAWMATVKVVTDMVTSIGLRAITGLDETEDVTQDEEEGPDEQ